VLEKKPLDIYRGCYYISPDAGLYTIPESVEGVENICTFDTTTELWDTA